MKKLSKGSIKLIALSIILVALASGFVNNSILVITGLIKAIAQSGYAEEFLLRLFVTTPVYVFAFIFVFKNIKKLYDNKSNKNVALVIAIISLFLVSYNFILVLASNIANIKVAYDYSYPQEFKLIALTGGIESILCLIVGTAFEVLNAVFLIKTRNAECDHIYKCNREEKPEECIENNEVEVVVEEAQKCPQCGAEVSNDSIFCTVCGAKIEK